MVVVDEENALGYSAKPLENSIWGFTPSPFGGRLGWGLSLGFLLS
jgi:hypothetical protein